MTVSRNAIFAVLALAGAIFLLFHGATVKATEGNSVQFEQRISQPAQGLEAPVTQVVITGQRMSEAEKAAFDRNPL